MMKRLILFFVMCVLWGAAFWGAGFVWFAQTAATLPSEIDVLTIKKPFGIAVLTGGRGRIEKGVELLGETKAPRLLISGVTPGVRLGDIAKRDGLNIDEDGRIELGYEATDTVGNAKEIKAWADKYQLKSIIVVTSFYHVLRSRLEILRAMSDAEVYFAAARSPYVRRDWWNSFESFKFLAAEYTKFLAVFVQYKVFGL